jgi:hypothetical protein
MERAKFGQASVELVVVLGITLIVILAFVILSSDFVSDLSGQRSYNDAANSVQRLAYAADSVFAQGDGASTQVKIVIPHNANLSPNASFIGKPSNAPASTASSLINIDMDGTDVFAVSKETVIGSFPNASGTFAMRVVSKGSYVAIGNYFFDVDKQSVYASMAKSEARSSPITFISTGNEAVSVALSTDWNTLYPNVPLTGLPSSFNLNPGGTNTVTLTFTSNANASGIYSTTLSVTGTSASGVAETFTIPMTVEVQ